MTERRGPMRCHNAGTAFVVVDADFRGAAEQPAHFENTHFETPSTA